MTSRADYAATLRSLAEAKVRAYLTAHSNLPGPRANLTLLDAAGDVLPATLALQMADEADEYLACCGVVAIGRLVLENAEPRLLNLLTERAADDRWRVREAVAIAVQRIGDADLPLLRSLVDGWLVDPNPLVVRAAIAAICEPRLLVEPSMAAAALDACRRATEHLLATAEPGRRELHVRTLRQALGYCWSVAVAADPVRGLPAFLALPTDDADLAWVVRENRKKQRLIRLLPADD